MFCAKCGSKVADNAKFCPGCGAPVNTTPGTNVPVTPSPADKPKKNTKLLIILIAAIALIGIVVALVLLLPGKGGYKDYNDLIDAYFEASADGDTDAVLKLVHPDVIESVTSVGYYGTDYLHEIDDWYRDGYYGIPVTNWYVEDYEYGDQEVITWAKDNRGIDIDNWVYVEVEVEFANGEYEDYDFDIINVDGKWYILDVW